MSFPVINFEEIPLSTELDWMWGFLFKNKWGWGKYIIKKHPKINEVFGLKSENEQLVFLKKYISNFREENKNKISENKIAYEKSWRLVEMDYFLLLTEILGTDWPEGRKEIKAMISINPICPRFLENWSFSMFFDYKKPGDAIETIMHESCHFLYFEKWKQVYPETNPKRFESPYIEWHLSEIIAPIILNDQRVQKLLKQKAEFYEEHKAARIDGIPASEYFTLIYNQEMQRGNFESFLKRSYSEISKNESAFVN